MHGFAIISDRYDAIDVHACGNAMVMLMDAENCKQINLC
jgi:hypothetical protein